MGIAAVVSPAVEQVKDPTTLNKSTKWRPE